MVARLLRDVNVRGGGLVLERSGQSFRKWLAPAPGTAHEELWRTRLTIEAEFLAWVLSLPLALGFLALGLWPQALVVGSFSLACFVLHRAILKGANFQRVASISLGLVLVELFASTRFDAVLDPVALAWLGLIPMIAGTLLGGRALLSWSALSLGVGALTVWLARDTWGLAPDPRRALLRAFFLAVIVVVYAWRLEHERQKALWAMADADQLKRRFLANVSHEIRTPMNGILGLTEVLLHGEATPAQRDGLEVIQRSGQALVSLVNDLLDLSKMEAGKLSLELAPLELRALAHDLSLLFLAPAQQKGLALTFEVDPALSPWLRADSLRLRQVLANLVSNAVKFTSEGSVRVDLTPRAGGAVRFEVRDTGPGIAAAVVPRLFTSFEQGDSATTRRFGGTGLGLALSRELVTLMKGRLELETAEGQGSCFWFELALPPCDAPPEVLTASPRAGATTLPVLVVDDNPVNLKVACALLTRLGVATRSAVNGVEAVAAAQADDFALVLMDCQMPEMDGLEATRRIRALPGPRSRVRIVALTASAMTDELAACRTAGMNDALSKPVTLAALARALEGA